MVKAKLNRQKYIKKHTLTKRKKRENENEESNQTNKQTQK